MSQVMVRFDPEADALYVALRERHPGDVVKTRELGDGRQVDYDEDGEILGVEFLFVSRGLNLDDVPEADTIEAALRAFPALSAA